jgi:serine/threonine-protein kinase RsbW
VRDSGVEFNPLDQNQPDLDLPLDRRPVGGLGIFLVRTLAVSVKYRRDGSRNILSFLVR